MKKSQIFLVVLAGFLWMAISQNVGVISFSLKPIIKFESPPSHLIFWLSAATNIGMLIGALFSGPLADHIGRKKTIVIYIVIHVISTILGGLSPDILVLILFRILVGFGVGGALPIIAALVSEYSSPNIRGRNISFLESFWAYGWLLSLILAWGIIPSYGWRTYMVIAGVISLIFSLSITVIPESQRYLLKVGLKDKARFYAEMYSSPYIEEISEVKLSKIEELALLFKDRMWVVTIPLWIIWFIITMGYYGIFIWLPVMVGKVVGEIGQFLQTNFYLYLFIVTLAQIPGYYSAVFLIDKVGRKLILSIYLIITGISSYFYAFSTDLTSFIVWGCVLSFFDLGAWAAIYTYTPEQYPTHIRGTGTSWATSCGRIGGILGPMTVFWLGGPSNWIRVFIFFAILHIIGGLIALLGRELKNLEMPELKRK